MFTPDTGLGPYAHEVSRLPESRLRRLVKWHGKVAGNDDGRPWFPLAIRRLELAERVELAEDKEYMAHWVQAEKLKVAEDVVYFTESYGHVQPERAGASPIPFELWELVEAAAERAMGARSQREVLEAFVRERIVVVLKARQLGLTWLALHYALWLMSYAPDLPRAKVLALSKKEDDATILLRRLRKINTLLPPYLTLAEDRETKGSLSRFKLKGRGEARSLVSSPDAARMEQADLFLWDEAAFTRNGTFEETWTAALPTLGDYGKAFLVSTGNGGEETPGDGQGFALLFGRAATGQMEEAEPSDMTAIFLPDDVNPVRDEAWRKRERRKFLSDASFEQEHARTAEEALQGKQGDKVYPLEGIAAAVKLGAELDAALAAGTLPEPAGASDGALAGGFDWGTFSHFLTVWELEGGGLYVPPGALPTFNVEISEKTKAFLEGVDALVRVPYAAGRRAQRKPPDAPRMREIRFDSAGVESMRAAVAYIAGEGALHHIVELVVTTSRKRPLRMRTVSVRFGGDAQSGKTGPKGTFKFETMEYLTWLFGRAARGERVGTIAISPRNGDLIRQLRGMEYMDDGSGRVVKEDDHGPDALVAGAAPIAAANRGRVLPVEDELEDRRRAA